MCHGFCLVKKLKCRTASEIAETGSAGFAVYTESETASTRNFARFNASTIERFNEHSFSVFQLSTFNFQLWNLRSFSLSAFQPFSLSAFQLFALKSAFLGP